MMRENITIRCNDAFIERTEYFGTQEQILEQQIEDFSTLLRAVVQAINLEGNKMIDNDEKTHTFQFESPLESFGGNMVTFILEKREIVEDEGNDVEPDPLFAKYPEISVYAYCANNPIKYTDPDGRWIPGLDNKGNVTYTAEKGDNHDTFITQFSTNGKSREIFTNAGFGVNAGDVKEGAVIKGDAVKQATGNEVLQGKWDGMTKNQKGAQIVFAINHSESKGEDNFDLQDYTTGFQIGGGGINLSNVNIPDGKGGSVPISNISIGCTYDNTKMTNSFNHNDPGGNIETYSTMNIYKGDPGHRKMIMFSVSKSVTDKFEKLFKK